MRSDNSYFYFLSFPFSSFSSRILNLQYSHLVYSQDPSSVQIGDDPTVGSSGKNVIYISCTRSVRIVRFSLLSICSSMNTSISCTFTREHKIVGEYREIYVKFARNYFSRLLYFLALVYDRRCPSHGRLTV